MRNLLYFFISKKPVDPSTVGLEIFPSVSREQSAEALTCAFEGGKIV